MNITEPFVLRPGVQLIPCAELSDDIRGRITYEEGDYTLSHRYGRSLAQVIDRDTAALLALFREPRTIVDAVIETARGSGKDPQAWLEELLPHLGSFVQGQVLVPAGSEAEQDVRPLLEGGTVFGDWNVVRCASLIEDSEVHQLRRGEEVAALKISRVTASKIVAAFENEVALLRLLEGRGAPRLIDSGVQDGRPYLVQEWIAGTDAGVAAAERRHDRVSLIELCSSIAGKYAELHRCGVLHGDVHPRNVLVEDGVTLIDFGFGREIEGPPRTGRAGLMYFFEPEMFSSGASPATEAGEQYAVASLLYFLITGQYCFEFRYEREEMIRQIREEPPLPFARRNVAPWPEVEAILSRALEKDPAKRFGSMGEMAARLASVRDEMRRAALDAPLSAEATALVEETLRTFARGGEMFEARYTTPPKASINYGTAGAAVGLLRIAETRNDAALLFLADVWRSRAVKQIGIDGAYYEPSRDLSRETLGDVTPYHTEAGIHAVAAMIAAAMGDDRARHRAIDAFLRASRKPCAELDLTLGRSGSLIAAAMLLASGEHRELRAFASGTMQEIWSELDRRPPIGHAHGRTYLGMAHGWAGYLYAALRWCAVSGDPVPGRLVERLREFADLRVLKGRGAWWPVLAGEAASRNMPGWCNGSAGHVFTFTLAHRLLGDAEWLRLAELAAWNNWDESRGPTTLCCGTSGRAYALLALYRHTGAREWLARARELANHAAAHAVETSGQRWSLWKGELGPAVLIADLASPENARMPFFE